MVSRTPRLAGDQGVALQRLFALREVRSANHVNYVGMNLAQGNDAHFPGAQRGEEFCAILQDAGARIPVGESEVQDFFRRGVFLRVRAVAIRG